MKPIKGIFAAWAEFPPPLQRLLLIRSGGCLLFLALFLWLAFTTSNLYLILSGAALLIAGWAAVIRLYFIALRKTYVVVSGICREVQVTTLRKKMKSLLLETDKGPLLVVLRQRHKQLTAGIKIDLYLTDSTPVYEKDGQQMVYAYLAIMRAA